MGTVASHIDHSCQFLAQAPHVHTSATLWVLPIVEDGEAVAQEIGPEGGRRVGLRQEGTYPLAVQIPSPDPPVQEQGAVFLVGVSESCALIQASLEGRVCKIIAIIVTVKQSGCGALLCMPEALVQSPAARKTEPGVAVTAALGRWRQKIGRLGLQGHPSATP